ncbi:MAG: hypothetical protein H6741_22070 [Alphaproteobacteria bacterium]|nr:hypothetical protein [Alphaproteobacteria bacterium]MCB9795400.1 hypothetical protein [Alphaproteobacteria bacterium]
MWVDLYDQHEKARALGTTDPLRELQKRVKVLVHQRRVEQRFLGKLNYKKREKGTGHRGAKEIAVAGDGTKIGEPIPISNLTNLYDGLLGIWVLVNAADNSLRKFTVCITGKTPDGAAWMASVELDQEPAGSGACGHALFHCHVGPSHSSLPEVRVPVPAIKPWDALDWLLTQVIPDWEPWPWQNARTERENRYPYD